MAEGATGPFLTLLDENAKLRGSRDPLGAQQVWTRMGRPVVGNLTTVSTSARDFTTTLLGYYFAERVTQEKAPGRELETFLMWEQLAAYSRWWVNKDKSFRGTDRVGKRLSAKSTVTISKHPDDQILSDQRIYGLWGLYTQPTRASGLLEEEAARLSLTCTGLPSEIQAPRSFVEKTYVQKLASAGFPRCDSVVRLLSGGAFKLSLEGKDENLVRAVASVLTTRFSDAERRFYEYFLLEGGPLDTTAGRTRGVQRQYLELIRKLAPDPKVKPLSPALLRALANEARRKDWGELAGGLDRIRICESVMAPAAEIFTYLQGRADEPVDRVVRRMTERWGEGIKSVEVGRMDEIKARLGDASAADRWLRIATAAAQGRYLEMIKAIIDHHTAVMSARGGAPWLSLEGRTDTIRVFLRDESGKLHSASELRKLWVFPYFLDAPRQLARSLGAAGD